MSRHFLECLVAAWLVFAIVIVPILGFAATECRRLRQRRQDPLGIGHTLDELARRRAAEERAAREAAWR